MNRCHSLLLLLATLPIVSCVHMREKRETYALPQDHPELRVGGAFVGVDMDPQDGRGTLTFSAMIYGFAAGTRIGPYKFRLFAVGRESVHQELRIHRVRYLLGDGRVWQEPGLDLALVKPFAPTLREDLVQALWTSSGYLPLDFDTLDSVTVEADIAVVSSKGTDRRTLRLPFRRTTLRQTHFMMAPVEVYQRVKHRKVPFEQLEIGANARDWKAPAEF